MKRRSISTIAREGLRLPPKSTSASHSNVYVVRSNERVTLRQRARGKRSRFRGIALGRLRPTSIFSRGGSRPDELPDDYDLASQNLFAGTGATSLGS